VTMPDTLLREQAPLPGPHPVRLTMGDFRDGTLTLQAPSRF